VDVEARPTAGFIEAVRDERTARRQLVRIEFERLRRRRRAHIGFTR
jgi:hypothetical protein